MQTVLLLASIQALFLSALLFSKRNKHISDKVLGTWLGLIGTHTLIYFCFGKFQFQNAHILFFNAGVPFLQGPFLFFYVDTLTAPHARLKRSYLWHLLPFALFVGNQLFIQNPLHLSPHAHRVNVHLFNVSMLSNAVLLLSVPAYATWSLLLLRNFRKRMLNTFSSIDRINLNWLRYLVTAMVIVWLTILVFFIRMKLSGSAQASGVSHLILAPVALFVYATGYFGFKQTAIFSDLLMRSDEPDMANISRPAAESTDQFSTNAEPSPKYQKSGLKEDEEAKTLARLLDYMERDRPYLDDQLTLPKIAADLALSVNHLSQVINNRRDENFFEFVNSFRVTAVQQKLQDPQNDAYSLLAIALDCGFGSKSSFNRIFKDVTGQTPSQYKKSL